MRLEKLQAYLLDKGQEYQYTEKMAAEALTGSTEVLCTMCGKIPV